MNGIGDSNSDDSDSDDSDDLAMLGSRFVRIASDTGDGKFVRRHDSDARDDRAPKRKSFRPREKMSRDKSS